MTEGTITICGSGIAGLALSLGLARAGLRPQLVGPRHIFDAPQSNQYYPRVYAVSPASRDFLASLGVWAMLNHDRITPVETMDVFGDASGKVTLNAWQAAQPALAWILESSELERALQQAVHIAGVSWYTEKFQSIENGMVVTDGGRRLAGALIVGADGGGSPVRHAAGIAMTSASYSEIGLVTHLTARRHHLNCARQWFGPDGILALLPMPDTADGPQVSMVWSMNENEANALRTLPETQRNAALQTRLQAATGGCLGELTVRSPLLGFPLVLEHSDMVAPGIALVSDAAHRVHPLAGQGLNLGLGDVQALIKVLRERPAYCALGDEALLRRYRRARAEPTLAMGMATDGLHRLFAPQFAPLVLLRNAGMQIVDRLPFIKRKLVAGASGDA